MEKKLTDIFTGKINSKNKIVDLDKLQTMCCMTDDKMNVELAQNCLLISNY